MQPIDQLVNNVLSHLQAHFSSHTRLYDIAIDGVQEPSTGGAAGVLGPGQTFMVEAYCGLEALHTTSTWSILLLSMDAHIALTSLLGKTCTLHTTLADGSRATTTGLITQAAQIGAEGGLARYRLDVCDASWMLGQALASRVWQDTAVLDIIASILTRYAPQLDWALSDEVAPFMAEAHQGGLRSYCVQYRETDLAFVSRLLAEEGLSWRVEECADSATKHRLVIFADSTQNGAFPQDYSSAHSNGGAGIRFHRGQSMEAQDTFQSLSQVRRLPSSIVTVLSTDYKTRQTHTASAPTTATYGGKAAPVLESYLPNAPYASGSSAAAQRQANLHMQALEARFERTLAGGTVRTLRAGTHLHITQSPLPEQAAGYNVIRVSHLGINNLPKPAVASLAELFGDVPELLGSILQDLSAKSASSPHGACASSSQNNSINFNPASLITQAQTLGYANQCELLRADVVWRPLIVDEAGTPLLPHSTAPGAQTALVVGPNGTPSDTSAGDLYTDALGRVRICFAWQDSTASTWVRVAQRSAGGGMGMQFLPRVGQEVLVQFLGGDIDRPIITGALYNGQGEGGVLPTPAGAANEAASNNPNNNPFAQSTDHRPSAQGNLVAGSMSGAAGNSPAWFGSAHGRHGDSENPSAGSTQDGGHANAAAQWGIRTQEWGGQGAGGGGGAGYNQLVFDDTDQQSRIQLKTSQYSTELNMGHLIHSADNHRGSLRGQGFELRTDAYGAVRAGAGLMFTTYGLAHNASGRDPAGDNSAALALLKQAKTLAQSFSSAAATHQTVTLASHVGTVKGNASAIDDKAAPLAALYKSSATQVSHQSLDSAQGDAPQKNTAPSATKLPHSADPTLSLVGQGGIAVVAGQNLQLANSETTSLMSGQDSQSITGGQLRMHSGQAIGILGGAIAPGEGNKGLTLIAAQDPVRYEAQSSTIAIQAKDLINIQSANAHIDWAAAKSISLSTAGGANITITGGNITIQCPGNLTVHASAKNFAGPASMGYALPQMPKTVCVPCMLAAARNAAPFAPKF